MRQFKESLLDVIPAFFSFPKHFLLCITFGIAKKNEFGSVSHLSFHLKSFPASDGLYKSVLNSNANTKSTFTDCLVFERFFNVK